MSWGLRALLSFAGIRGVKIAHGPDTSLREELGCSHCTSCPRVHLGGNWDYPHYKSMRTGQPVKQGLMEGLEAASQPAGETPEWL